MNHSLDKLSVSRILALLAISAFTLHAAGSSGSASPGLDEALSPADAPPEALLGATAGPVVSFEAVANYTLAAARNPDGIVMADFQEGGGPDIITANQFSYDYCLLPNNGEGVFDPNDARSFRYPTEPSDVVTGVFNPHGYMDLAVTDKLMGFVWIYGNGGKGTFPTMPVNYKVGESPVALAAGKLDRDKYRDCKDPNGCVDLAVANRDSGDVSVLIGRGTGYYPDNFAPAVSYPVGGSLTKPVDIALGDIKGSPRLDIVTLNEDRVWDRRTRSWKLLSVTVLRNLGGWAFGRPDKIEVAGYKNPVSMVLGHFIQGRRYQYLDMAVLCEDMNSRPVLILLRGNRDGSFEDSPSYVYSPWKPRHKPRCVSPSSLVVLNLNNPLCEGGWGCRKPTTALAVADAGEDTVWVIEFRPEDPGWGRAYSVFLGPTADPISITAADMDGDGFEDLATANEFDHTVSIIQVSGDRPFERRFAIKRNLPVAENPLAVAAAVLHGDPGAPNAIADIATANGQDEERTTSSILLNQGGWDFQQSAGSPFPVMASPFALESADLNGDGYKDLVSVTKVAGDVAVSMGKGDGTFGTPQFKKILDYVWDVVLGDVNKDGIIDVVTGNYMNGNVSVMLGKLDKTTTPDTYSLAEPVNYTAVPYVQSVALGDANGDGCPDIGALGVTQKNIGVMLGKKGGKTGCQGEFDKPVVVSLGSRLPIFLDAGKLDETNKDGFVTANQTTGNVTVLRGFNGTGFDHIDDYTTGSTPVYVIVAPIRILDPVQPKDIAVANMGSNTVSVLVNDGLGAFTVQGPFDLPADSHPFSIEVGDLNQDGLPDIATANYGVKDNSENDVSVLIQEETLGE